MALTDQPAVVRKIDEFLREDRTGQVVLECKDGRIMQVKRTRIDPV